jgi:glucosamine--fructose-6-phosphate aminotransferase (isomerizing)
MTLMLEEIHEQPAVAERIIAEERHRLERIAIEIRRRNPSSVVIAARGSSDNAATYAKYLFGIFNRLPVVLAAPSLATLYGAAPVLRDALVIGVSQSGESTDIVEVVRGAREQGAFALGITANADSSLAKASDEIALLHAGVERSVAATKTYTAQLTVLCLLSAMLSGSAPLLDALERVPAVMSDVLLMSANESGRAERYRYMAACAVLGRGLNYCTALEIALKLKETSYVVADPFSTADFRHGPIAIVGSDFPLLLFAAPGPTFADMLRVAGDLRARNADLVVFSSEQSILDLATVPIALPLPVVEGLAGEAVSPLVYALAGQLFAHGVCTTKGLNPDQPRGLNKVTLTM